ncbi:MAG: hypothetical protein H0X27_04200 [Caulobacteraceae bacterium]|nr:hypothetical protein [Caulobacteraceae bacterium]
MKQNALGGIEVVTLDEAKNYERLLKTTAGKTEAKSSQREFRRKLKILCSTILQKIQNNSGLRDAYVQDGYGRACIMTDGGGGEGDYRVSVGFLYNPIDHKTAFVDPAKPLDIAIRIQAKPDANGIAAARKSLAPLAHKLEKLGYDCDPNGGGWKRNAHTVLIGQRTGIPLESQSGRAQAEALAPFFSAAFAAVFDDPKIRAAVRKLNPY